MVKTAAGDAVYEPVVEGVRLLPCPEEFPLLGGLVLDGLDVEELELGPGGVSFGFGANGGVMTSGF
jgi:hypothetical protein